MCTVDQAVNYIALAIPVFFLLIGIEAWIAHRRGKPWYRLNDSINDLSMGVLQQITGVFAKGAIYYGYFLIYDRWHLFDWPMSQPWTWIVGFLGVDFCYYWFHRFSHEINIIWGSHIAHHQSEEYNLTVALRQGAFQPFFSAVFYWPLALLGLDPIAFLALSSFNTLYQFWIHTRAIGRLWAPIEWIFNTPSHHRVHHGCNPQYIDRNHGGTLIIWDRLFGTFEPERDEVVYGVTKPLRSWNPVWANLHYFVELWQKARRARRWRDRFLVWVMPPHWHPPDVEDDTPVETPLNGFRYDADAPPPGRRYAVVQFIAAVAATVALLFAGPVLPLDAQIALAAWSIWTLVNVNAVFEQPPWLTVSEYLRLLAAPALLIWLPPLPPALSALVVLWASGSLAAWHAVRRALYMRNQSHDNETPLARDPAF